MSPIRQPVGRFICFAVFGNDQKLLYSKYNQTEKKGNEVYV